MEYHLTEKTIPIERVLLDTVSEQPVDVDLTLPDYCPDIERILRCSLIPRIYLSNVSGDRLSVEGAACVRILYLDSEKGRIRAYEHTAPFSESFELKDSPGDCAVYVDAKPEYMNCRAMSPRKLSLHGAFSLRARVIVSRPLSYMAYDDGGDLQVRLEPLSASSLSGLCRDIFSVREDISMSGREAPSAILSHSLSFRITELKAIRDKLMLSAEGRLELMYLGEDGGDPQLMTCAFPLSRIIDCEGAGEDCVISPELSVMTYDLSLNDDALGGSAVLALDARLCFNALCYSERELSVIADVFAVDRQAEAHTEPLSCRGRVRELSFSDTAKGTVRIDGEGISRMIGVRPERIAVSAAVSGGAPLLSSRLTVSLMYVSADGEIKYIDRELDFDYNPSIDGCDAVDKVSAAVDSLSYRLIDEHTVELRAEVCYRLRAAAIVNRQAAARVTAPDEPDDAPDGDSLILYYADSGESVWDISKRFRSRPADVMAENELEADVLDSDLMLLIP